MALSTFGRLVRTGLKRALYANMALRDASLVLRGKRAPLLPFIVEASPPSVYFNFAIAEERLRAFEAHLALPSGFRLTKVQTLEGGAPYHCLTLNAYRVSGITSGTRAEWSVYVDRGDGVPRYMVIEGRQDGFTMDPVDIVVRGSRVEHTADGERLLTFVESSTGNGFRADCQLPGPGAPRATAARAWVEANDVIYWRNGVADRVYYGASLANGAVWSLPLDSVDVHNDTPWGAFTEPGAREVLVLTDRLELVISPWCNL